jgi:hypothetical protein
LLILCVRGYAECFPGPFFNHPLKVGFVGWGVIAFIGASMAGF